VAEGGADLGGFLEAAGRSLADAQGGLAGKGLGIPGAVAIAEAELEIKATVEGAATGELALQPVSGKDIREADISPGVLSTVRIRYVAVADDTLVAPAEEPSRTADTVIGEVRRRKDVAAIAKILGGLEFDAAFVPATKRWLVTARDQQARVVREVVVPDTGR
jgi:hypothetical protein